MKRLLTRRQRHRLQRERLLTRILKGQRKVSKLRRMTVCTLNVDVVTELPRNCSDKNNVKRMRESETEKESRERKQLKEGKRKKGRTSELQVFLFRNELCSIICRPLGQPLGRLCQTQFGKTGNKTVPSTIY